MKLQPQQVKWRLLAIFRSSTFQFQARSVGVHGDVRAYGETVVVRAVQSLDGMSARYSTIPHDVLAKISTRITNTVKGAVNRVVYDITHKPPGTIEWE